MVFKNHAWNEKDSDKYVCATMSKPNNRQYCLGKYCAMWRWHETHLPNEDGILISDGETMGFCGLAGPTTMGKLNEQAS